MKLSASMRELPCRKERSTTNFSERNKMLFTRGNQSEFSIHLTSAFQRLGRRLQLATLAFLAMFALAGLLLGQPAMAAEKVELSVDVSKPGPTISRNIFGQFAEHLGHGVYGGIWVGPNSTIPNTRGI